MWRKIIDDYRLIYLNDLFEIKWIFLRSKSFVAILKKALNTNQKITDLYPQLQFPAS